MRRPQLAAVALTAALCITLPTATAATATAAPTTQAGGLDWKPCPPGKPGADPDPTTAQCATLSVPVDWAHPDGPRFGLAVARRTAKDPAARVGTLVFGPGGPGDSGVERVATGISRFSADLQRRFDIVSFDPRGVGGSNPLLCSPALLAERPSPVVTTKAAYDETMDYNRRLRADCRARTGPVYDHLDSLSTVRDLDALRAALGEQQLTFHGSSYGTLLGELYAERYPRRIRAMVLEGVVDHSLGTRRFLDTQAATIQDSFDQFVAWCNGTAACALHGRDVRAVYAGLMDRAGRGLLDDPAVPGHRLSPFDLSFATLKRMYGPDYSKFGNQLAALDAAPPPSGPPVVPPMPPAFPIPIFCQDWDLTVRNHHEYAAHVRRLERIAPDVRYPGALMAVSTCLGAPPDTRAQHRLRVRHSPVIVLTNSQHDPATGYEWATNVKRQLGDSAVLLTYDGAGHGTYNSSACAKAAIDHYLLTTVPPPPDTHCS